MALRIRYRYTSGSALGYSIERLSDGLIFDFNDTTFKVVPTTLINTLPEDMSNFLGRFKTTLISTPSAQFADGDYVVTIHNTGSANLVVGELSVVMHGGDDATVIPSSAGVVDPWSVAIPGTYPAGTAGSIVGGNLDTKVSSRSTYSGGIVAGVTAPVVVGTNNDKSGYTLSASGLDSVPIEAGVNARQALSPIFAASAGVLLGAGTGTIVIKGGNVAVTRITASTDNAGNRTAVVLSLPT